MENLFSKFLAIMVLFLIFSGYSIAQINSKLFDKLVVAQINNYRIENGIDSLIRSEELDAVAKSESDFQCDFPTGEDDPEFNNKLAEKFGQVVYQSYNVNITDYWDLNKVKIGYDVEEVFAKSVLDKFKSDHREDIILKIATNRSVKGFISVYSQIKNNTFYSTLLIYIENP